MDEYRFASCNVYYVLHLFIPIRHRDGRQAGPLAKFINGKAELTLVGKKLYGVWTLLPIRFPQLAIDAFRVIPDYVHGIFILDWREQEKKYSRSSALTECKGVIRESDVETSQFCNIELLRTAG